MTAGSSAEPGVGGSGCVRKRRRRRWPWVALVAGGALVLWLFLRGGPSIPEGTVLVVDLGAEVPERGGDGLLMALGGSSVDILDLAVGLERAAADPRVVGVLLKIQGGGAGPGTVDELRGIVQRFRRGGKPALALASAPDTLGYYLATAADEVLLDRSTTLDAVGIRLTAFFLKEALARLGVEADLLRVGDFKGAYEELALPGPTPELEETMGSLVESVYETVTEGVAAARGLEAGVVRALFDRCPMPPEEALREKLVDRLAEGDSVRRRLEEKMGREVRLLPASRYIEACRGGSGTPRRIAVVHVIGTIVEGETRELLLAGVSTGADTVVRVLRQAADDVAVAAVLLRVDSPGGMVSASEKIHEALREARKRKPVVASFGGAAASGGYYAACAAERILAHPTSLTGSIGVFGGKLVVQDFLAQHRVETRAYSRGKRAGMSDFTRRYSAEERMALKEILEDCYRRFVDSVASGRKKGFEEIHAVAQGRVWTGARAVGAGLVDGMGGIGEAVSLLRELARVPAGEPLDLEPLPPRPSLWSIFGEGAGDDSFVAAKLHRAGGLQEIRSLAEAAGLLREMGLLDGTARLALMPFSIVWR